MDGWLVVKISREWTEIIVYNKSLGHPRIWYKIFLKFAMNFHIILNRFLVHMVLILHMRWLRSLALHCKVLAKMWRPCIWKLDLALHCNIVAKIWRLWIWKLDFLMHPFQALYINLDQQWFVTKAFWEVSYFWVTNALFCTGACPLHKRRAVITKHLVICEELHHMYPSRYVKFLLPN